jgi:hypothetical protein
MEYTTVTNPVWVDSSHTAIAVDVVFPEIGDKPVRFNATPNDVMPYGVEIYNAAVAGKYGAIAEKEVTGQ